MCIKKMGRPTDSQKEHRLQIRVDENTLKLLDECVEATGKSRNGIETVHRTICK